MWRSTVEDLVRRHSQRRLANPCIEKTPSKQVMTLARIIDGHSQHHQHHGSTNTRAQGPDARLGARDRNPPAEHPVVRIHPNTGEKCLDINPLMMSFIKELQPDESKDPLDFLYRKMIEPQFMVR
jgi:taurine dioxygenase